MEDQLETFFSKTDFDTNEPRFGHLERFEQRLNFPKKGKANFYKWVPIAASILLFLGFWLGSNQSSQTILLADVSPKMEQAESFFVSTILQETKEIEKYRNPKTERVIEDALSQLENLEDQYKELVKELNKSNKDRRVIYAMITNYQNRIEILQDVLKQVENINKIKVNQNDEIYI